MIKLEIKYFWHLTSPSIIILPLVIYYLEINRSFEQNNTQYQIYICI